MEIYANYSAAPCRIEIAREHAHAVGKCQGSEGAIPRKRLFDLGQRNTTSYRTSIPCTMGDNVDHHETGKGRQTALQTYEVPAL